MQDIRLMAMLSRKLTSEDGNSEVICVCKPAAENMCDMLLEQQFIPRTVNICRPCPETSFKIPDLE